MRRDLTLIIVGLLGVLLCCLNECTLNTSGLDNPTVTGAVIPAPEAHPNVEVQHDAGSLVTTAPTETNAVDAGAVERTPEWMDAATGDAIQADVYLVSETQPEGIPGCYPGALYSSDAGLVPCPS